MSSEFLPEGRPSGMIFEVVGKAIATLVILGYVYLRWRNLIKGKVTMYLSRAVEGIVVVFLLITIWGNQVMWPDTLGRLIGQPAEMANEMIQTRNPNFIYQDGVAVGEATPPVMESENKVVFSRLHNTSKLKRDAPFEYKKYRLKIVSIKTKGGTEFNTKQTYRDVLIQVECEVLE